MQRLFSIHIYQLRAFALFVALSVYAVFGSPTPEAFGVVEASVGGLLVLAIGVSGVAGVLRFRYDTALWFGAGQVLLIYGLAAGIIGGLMRGQDVGAMLRDVIPFLFLFLPLFLMPLMRDMGARFYQILLVGVLVIGGAFSVRGALLSDDALYYLGNSPCVLFMVLFGIGMGVERLSLRFSVRNVVLAVCSFALAGLAVLPLIDSVQRASLGVAALYAAFAAVVVFMRAPRRVLALSAFALPALWLFAGDNVQGVWGDIAGKTDLVGGNRRVEEWRAVWAEISAAPLSVLFGNGFGGGVSSPAVADIRVNYTHSLLSSMLLKTGLCGMGLMVLYLYGLGRLLLGCLKGRVLVAVAIALPILIDVFLYAAYKSLDFGVMLTMISAVFFCAYGLKDRASWCIHNR